MTVNRSDIVQQLMEYNIAQSTEKVKPYIYCYHDNSLLALDTRRKRTKDQERHIDQHDSTNQPGVRGE